MTSRRPTDDQEAADYRDPSVWRSGLAAARAAVHAVDTSPPPAERPRQDETVRSSEGAVARSRQRDCVKRSQELSGTAAPGYGDPNSDFDNERNDGGGGTGPKA